MTTDPDVSPAADGSVAETLTVRLCPGASVTELGDTDPNGTCCWVDTSHGTTPLVPPADATLPKMTPVHVPAVGASTSVSP
jgi:hypothetical protein